MQRLRVQKVHANIHQIIHIHKNVVNGSHKVIIDKLPNVDIKLLKFITYNTILLFEYNMYLCKANVITILQGKYLICDLFFQLV